MRCNTVFHGTKIALQKMVCCNYLNSEYQEVVIQPSVSTRFVLESENCMVYNDAYKSRNGKKGGVLLQGIIEADETYIGGKPRKPNKKKDHEPAKSGRGTEKDTIIGAVERGRKVEASWQQN